VADVVELTKSPAWSATRWYGFASIYALASGKIADKQHEYADRAMELLKKAVQAGWTDRARMARDTDLDAIRGRQDFKKLIERMGEKSTVKPHLQD
jgi:hypothetical protein